MLNHYKKLCWPISIWPLSIQRPWIFWLGVVLLFMGAFVEPIDLGPLKEWQTLLGAMVALMAAGIAYRGAMAKVNFDRESEARKLERQKIGLYLRLSFTLDALQREAVKVAKAANWEGDSRMNISDMGIPEPTEICEAWANLELFPGKVSINLLLIRSSLDALNVTVDSKKDER